MAKFLEVLQFILSQDSGLLAVVVLVSVCIILMLGFFTYRTHQHNRENRIPIDKYTHIAAYFQKRNPSIR